MPFAINSRDFFHILKLLVVDSYLITIKPIANDFGLIEHNVRKNERKIVSERGRERERENESVREFF